MTQRGYSKDAIMEMEFPTKEYEFPETAGKFIGTLVMKKWNSKGGLLCYFDTDDGRKLKLCVWFNYKSERSYRPKSCDLDISYVNIGSTLQVEHAITKSGKSKWLTAELLSLGSGPSDICVGDFGSKVEGTL